VNAVQKYLENTVPQKENESSGAYKSRIRTAYADVCRYYLPACSLANVGMTINARALEHAICKMLSHPLEEVQVIGQEIKKVSQENIPTLVKYANRNECMVETMQDFSKYQEKINVDASDDWLRIVHYDEQGELRVLAALLVRFGEISFEQAFHMVSEMPEDEMKNLADLFLGKLGDHDIPLRELEYANLTAEIILDQGAYFELKRHRMMSQTPQRFTARLGFATPRLIAEAGLLDAFTADMHAVEDAYEQLRKANPEAAAYILPNAFNRRVLIQTNLRSALHFVKLRSAPNAHFAIRRVAQRLACEIRQCFPLFARYFTPDSSESWQSVTQDYFQN